MNDTPLATLLTLWNNATSSTAMRTDEQHEASRKKARRLMTEIRARFTEGVHYRESDYTGRLLQIERPEVAR